ncbi:MAG: hypothetical protein WCH77_09275 [Planctomycetota bacterium]
MIERQVRDGRSMPWERSCGRGSGMLVVTANWSITDGTLVGGPSWTHGLAFLAGIRRSAARAGFRCDGGYRPIDRVEIVLAGDTFDWLLSAEWLGAERPWRPRARQELKRDRVMQAAVRCGARLLGRLGGLARRGLVVPVADSRGRPIVGSCVRVPVRVTLLAGDRDAWLECRDSAAVARRFGMAVGGSWTDGGVAIVHGHEFDPLSGPGRWAAAERPPTLHESLTVDLLGRFAATLHDGGSLGDGALPDSMLRRLLRPLATGQPIDAPRQLATWLEHAVAADGLPAAARGQVENAWRRTVDGWQQRARREVPESELQFDAVDAVAAWMARLDGDCDVPAAFARPTAVLGRITPRTAVFGHLPAGHAAIDGGPRTRTICLGPRPLRRSGDPRISGRSSAVDVALIPPVSDGHSQRPPVVTIFAAGEAGRTEAADLIVGDAAGEETTEMRDEGVWIVDAA